MRKVRQEETTSVVDVVYKICCNHCGINIPLDMEGPEFISISKMWGYFSKKDMCCQSLDVCESCWDKFCDECVIPPSIIDHISGEDLSIEPTQLEFDFT